MMHKLRTGRAVADVLHVRLDEILEEAKTELQGLDAADEVKDRGWHMFLVSASKDIYAMAMESQASTFT
jgi:phosphoserine phosphatase